MGPIAPGTSGSRTSVLTTGSYVLLRFIPDLADGVPHVAKGMVPSLTVTGDAGGAKLPEAAATARMKDFAFELPTISSGPTTLRVVNEGAQEHLLYLVKMEPGASPQDAFAFFEALESGAPPSGPPPFRFAGEYPGTQDLNSTSIST